MSEAEANDGFAHGAGAHPLARVLDSVERLGQLVLALHDDHHVLVVLVLLKGAVQNDHLQGNDPKRVDVAAGVELRDNIVKRGVG